MLRLFALVACLFFSQNALSQTVIKTIDQVYNASATQAGIVTTAAQTLSGVKTFSNHIVTTGAIITPSQLSSPAAGGIVYINNGSSVSYFSFTPLAISQSITINIDALVAGSQATIVVTNGSSSYDFTVSWSKTLRWKGGSAEALNTVVKNTASIFTILVIDSSTYYVIAADQMSI